MVKTRFGAKRPLLIMPHGPPPPWKTKSGSYTPSGYNALWHGHPGTSPPSWNPLLLQTKSVHKMSVNKPSLKSVKFGKKKVSKGKKPSKALRMLAKKYKVKITVKRGKKRVYKTKKQLQNEIKRAMRKHVKKLTKDSKKPSKRTLKAAKKLGIKVTTKRGKKRVHKSEKVLKKQIKQKLKVKANQKRRALKSKLRKRSNKRRHKVVKRRVKAKSYLDELRSRVAHKRAMKSIAARKRYSGPKLKADFGAIRYF